MTRKLIALALVVAACAPTGSDSTSTTVGDTTTSAVAPTTTMAPVTTTTVAPTTTTTVPPTTTTVPPTTTTTLLEGNWADQPLIIARMGALGWWNGSAWVDAQEEGALPVIGGEDYQVARFGSAGVVFGEAPTTLCEPFINNLGINVNNPDLLGEWPGPAGVAISAPWALQPHLVEAFVDNGTYSQFAHDLILSRGLDVANPVIKVAYRFDLEGDGINEVIVVAEFLQNGFIATAGDYSIVFMRKVVEGEVQTAVLGSTVVTDPEGVYEIAYDIGAIVDLNNDGKMEIVLNEAGFEGLGVHIVEYVNDDLGPVPVLSVGCGA